MPFKISRRSLLVGGTASLASALPHWSVLAREGDAPYLSSEEMIKLAPGLLGQLKSDMIKHTVCVDGRGHESIGLIRTPGAAKGILIRALSYAAKLATTRRIHISPDQMFEAVAHSIGGEKHFNYHIGCAYCDLVKVKPNRFDATPSITQSSDEMMQRVPVRPDVLQGKHTERAALVVRQRHIGHVASACVVEDFATLGGVEKRVFVHRPDLMETIVLPALAKHLISNSTQLAESMDEGTVVRDLVAMEEAHFLRLIKEIAPMMPIYEMQLDWKRISIRVVRG